MGTLVINGLRICHDISNQSFSELGWESINSINTFIAFQKTI